MLLLYRIRLAIVKRERRFHLQLFSDSHLFFFFHLSTYLFAWRYRQADTGVDAQRPQTLTLKSNAAVWSKNMPNITA